MTSKRETPTDEDVEWHEVEIPIGSPIVQLHDAADFETSELTADMETAELTAELETARILQAGQPL